MAKKSQELQLQFVLICISVSKYLSKIDFMLTHTQQCNTYPKIDKNGEVVIQAFVLGVCLHP